MKNATDLMYDIMKTKLIESLNAADDNTVKVLLLGVIKHTNVVMLNFFMKVGELKEQDMSGVAVSECLLQAILEDAEALSKSINERKKKESKEADSDNNSTDM